MTFKPTHDLESLTEQQREQYYMSACEYFQVPPELRLLEFMWLDTNDGKRNLVLYAKKGATDMIRANLKISVTSTTRADGPGYVAFIVEGKDASGRTEQAVGSASIDGLRGQGLANAVMIAHTRATRRMSLQFVGGGLLDESEVQGVVSDISRSGASLASLATLPAPIQPSGAPNTQPGKDITPLSGIEAVLGVKAPSVLSGTSSLAAALTSVQTPATPKPPMVAPAPFSSGDITPKTVEPLVHIEPLPEPKKRHRRTKSEMAATRGVISLDSPASTDVESHKPGENQRVTAIVEKVAKQAALESPVVALAEVATTPVINPDMPTPAEVTAWKAHLSAYTERQTGILAQGGMTENVFGKIRLYTMKLFPGAIVLPSRAIMLTNSQWETLLATFKQIVTERGPTGLVEVIEGAVKQ
jgi:hypothetical protein